MSSHDDALFELQQTLYTSRNPTRRWLHQSRREWIVSAISRYGEGAGAALEIGPGSGVYLAELAKAAETVVASDIERAYLERLRPIEREHANIRLLRDDITQSALEEASFDLILCTEVIEHIRDSRAALREIRRVLRPGGILVLSTPQRYSPLEVCGRVAFLPGIVQLVRWIYKEPVLETGHINLLTRRALQEQLRAAGLVICETELMGVYLPFLAEALGTRTLRWEQSLEPRLRARSTLSWLLWTQLVIATRE